MVDPNNIENRYDNDYSRHVKREAEEMARRGRPPSTSQLSGEGLLAAVIAGAVGFWDYSSHFVLEWWGHALLIGGTFIAAIWFFRRYQWITKTILFGIAGTILFWLIFYS